MIGLITLIVTVIGIGFGIWRRFYSHKAKIRKNDKRIGKILREQQDALEDNDMDLFAVLDVERLQRLEEIRRLR